MKGGGSSYSQRKKAKSPGETHRGYDADREPPIHLRLEYMPFGHPFVNWGQIPL
jgi:hypothetical protein